MRGCEQLSEVSMPIALFSPRGREEALERLCAVNLQSASFLNACVSVFCVSGLTLFHADCAYGVSVDCGGQAFGVVITETNTVGTNQLIGEAAPLVRMFKDWVHSGYPLSNTAQLRIEKGTAWSAEVEKKVFGIGGMSDQRRDLQFLESTWPLDVRGALESRGYERWSLISKATRGQAAYVESQFFDRSSKRVADSLQTQSPKRDFFYLRALFQAPLDKVSDQQDIVDVRVNRAKSWIQPDQPIEIQIVIHRGIVVGPMYDKDISKSPPEGYQPPSLRRSADVAEVRLDAPLNSIVRLIQIPLPSDIGGVFRFLIETPEGQVWEYQYSVAQLRQSQELPVIAAIKPVGRFSSEQME